MQNDTSASLKNEIKKMKTNSQNIILKVLIQGMLNASGIKLIDVVHRTLDE